MAASLQNQNANKIFGFINSFLKKEHGCFTDEVLVTFVFTKKC